MAQAATPNQRRSDVGSVENAVKPAEDIVQYLDRLREAEAGRGSAVVLRHRLSSLDGN